VATILPLAVPPKLRSYLRPGRTTSARLAHLIAQRQRVCDGVVLDPTLWSRQADLARVARAARVDTILDPRSLELASAGGHLRTGIKDLPWYTSTVQGPGSLAHVAAQEELVGPIAEYISNRDITAVLIPGHFIESKSDPWIGIDNDLSLRLQQHLIASGRPDVRVIRPLYLHSNLLRQTRDLESIRESLVLDGVSAIWLAVHPFGTSSAGPLSLRRYIEAAYELKRTNLPVMGLNTGTIGLLLMAVGALDGIESGLTDGEGFDIGQHAAPPAPKGNGATIGSTPRVYIPTLGVFLTTKEARAFFSVRGMTGQHACQIGCCPRGVEDMIGRRLDHFIVSRDREVADLSAVPTHLRARVYLDSYLRPASDRAVAAERAHPRMKSVRKRLDDWRRTVSSAVDGGAATDVSASSRDLSSGTADK